MTFPVDQKHFSLVNKFLIARQKNHSDDVIMTSFYTKFNTMSLQLFNLELMLMTEVTFRSFLRSIFFRENLTGVNFEIQKFRIWHDMLKSVLNRLKGLKRGSKVTGKGSRQISRTDF